MKVFAGLILITGLLFFSFFLFRKTESDPIAVQAKQNVRNALSLVGLTEEDLNFKKDVQPDENISPLVRTLLKKPLSLFDFSISMEKELQKMPWNQTSPSPPQGHCQVKDWGKTPEDFKPLLQSLLNGLNACADRFQNELGTSSLSDKQIALRTFAIENFHVDKDAESRSRWAELSGGEEDMEGWMIRADTQAMEETNWIASQLKVAAKINPVRLREEMQVALTCIQDFVEKSKKWTEQKTSSTDFEVIEFETSLGRVILAGKGSQKLKGDAALTIDFGGNDIYAQAGCADGINGISFSVAIDLAGDDFYQQAGSGIWGTGIIWDEKGNDRYESSDASLGCGLFGAGMLVDRSGDDTYTGDTFGQGAGVFGFGWLWDGADQDRYSISVMGQGFAGVNGLGILSDHSGNDFYQAGKKYADDGRLADHFLSLSQGFSIGYRPFAAGGIGILFDEKGNDRYECDIFGQGCGYWYSCGMLIDSNGDDFYRSGQYAQGSGIHLAVGLLKDGKGNDHYENVFSIAQGGSHDFGVGLLWESEGNDVYQSSSQSQGSGINNAVGILYDENGNDVYRLHTNGVGQGVGTFTDRRGIGSIGVMLDINGSDDFSRPIPVEGYLEQEQIGIVVDAPDLPVLEKWSKSWATKKTSEQSYLPIVSRFLVPDSRVFGSLIANTPADPGPATNEIIAVGGDWETGRVLMQAARYAYTPEGNEQKNRASQLLNNFSADKLDGLLPWMAQRDVMMRVLMEAMANRLKKDALPALRRHTESPFLHTRGFSVFFLGELGSSEDIPYVLSCLQHDRTRPVALLALSKLGIGENGDRVLPYLNSKRELERALTVKIIGRSAMQNRYLILAPFLSDSDWNVRWQTVQTLQNGEQSDKEALKKIYPKLSPLGKFWAQRVETKSKK